jgi:hypothetical protein
MYNPGSTKSEQFERDEKLEFLSGNDTLASQT